MTIGASPVDRPVHARDGAFHVGQEVRELYGAAVHYWRLDRDKWDGILQTVRDMGYTMITIYMPWEIHEIERGRFDFGEIDPRKDLDAFLSLIETKGMDIIARPGPQNQLGADGLRLSGPHPRRPRAPRAQRAGDQGGPHAGPPAHPGAGLRLGEVPRRGGSLV